MGNAEEFFNPSERVKRLTVTKPEARVLAQALQEAMSSPNLSEKDKGLARDIKDRLAFATLERRKRGG